jgi:UDP-N-acetylglucosamine acyltransferase
VIGSPPEITSASQNLAWDGELEHHGVVVGDGVVIRETSTIQQGSRAPTIIGAGSWLLSRTYVAHDCVLGPGVTTSAGVSLGGYARIGEAANIGMNATVHQRRSVGTGAMVGMSSAVTRDVPPFAKAFGVPARVRGANTVGMIRSGFDHEVAEALEAAYSTGRGEQAAAILARLEIDG